MEPIQAITLGIIQGLTEFLPVSSSGHLVLLQNLFGFKEPELLLDISLHVGTLIAVCIVFFKEIRAILGALVRLPGLIRIAGGLRPVFNDNEDVRIAVLILVGSIPTAILGFLFHKISNQIFGTVWIVGVMLMVTGTLLWLTRQLRSEGRPLLQVSMKDALIVGVIQGLAVLPGISRSGSTISVALLLGVDREVSGRYSFLLSIPAILGAMLLGFDSSITHNSVSGGIILLGTFFAGIVGYAALKILLHIIKQGQLYWFAPYCWLLGVGALIWNWL
ncbi:undecaprenyl-diphosphate phosphatase [Thermodesulfobacteriota bacterium]